MEVADVVAKPMRDFAKDSVRLVKKCTKPDAREFWKIASRTATGFVVMGFVGFFVKLIFVPINQIILSSCSGRERGERRDETTRRARDDDDVDEMNDAMRL